MVTGWDIGGANIKAARVHHEVVEQIQSVPFAIQHTPRELVPTLRRLAAAMGTRASEPHAVTMTAELSQFFRTKREGVAFVIDAVLEAFPRSAIHIFTVSGEFVTPAAGANAPLDVAAANWAATAMIVAPQCPDAVLIDVGTTTTDIIPIAGGIVDAQGRTDPERLRTGELLYLGAVRTPVEAIVHEVPLGRGMAGVAAEAFALAGDVHVWRGELQPEDYTAPTPDGRPGTREFARERLARVVCADREMLNDEAITAIADHVANAQVARMVHALAHLLERHPSITTAITAGVGSFIAHSAAVRYGLRIIALSSLYGSAAARAAPAAAVAFLLERALLVS